MHPKENKFQRRQGRLIQKSQPPGEHPPAGPRHTRHQVIQDHISTLTRQTGPSLSPFNAWVLLKGLETLAVRVCRQTETAATVAVARSKTSWSRLRPRPPQARRVRVRLAAVFIVRPRTRQTEGHGLDFRRCCSPVPTWRSKKKHPRPLRYGPLRLLYPNGRRLKACSPDQHAGIAS
jgi:hypothetical protein